ncbi:MAG: hypothetical protein M3203_11830 [Actinomycetota bacterium]|nr:hypothetical protein [Actinomycetota bacterium]
MASGSACGYYTNVALFGGPPSLRGCGQAVPPGDERSASPSVELPPEGSATAITVDDDNGAIAQYGPAIVFGGKPPAQVSGPIKVSTRGKRSVTSSAEVKDFSAGPFTADAVRTTCTASASGTKESTTIRRGVLVLATDAQGNPTRQEELPSKPPANFTRRGVNSAGDKFRAVINEQKVGRDGTITVTAVHLYLLGPTATGEVVVAQARAKV